MQKPFNQIRSEDLVVFKRSEDLHDTLTMDDPQEKKLGELIRELHPN